MFTKILKAHKHHHKIQDSHKEQLEKSLSGILGIRHSQRQTSLSHKKVHNLDDAEYQVNNAHHSHKADRCHGRMPAYIGHSVTDASPIGAANQAVHGQRPEYGLKRRKKQGDRIQKPGDNNHQHVPEYHVRA